MSDTVTKENPKTKAPAASNGQAAPPAKRKATALERKLGEYIASAQSLIVIRSDEPAEVEENLVAMCREYIWSMWYWDCFSGMSLPDGANNWGCLAPSTASLNDPTPPGTPPAMAKAPPPLHKIVGNTGALAVLKVLQDADNKLEDGDEMPLLLVSRNLHRFWRDDPNANLIVQAVQNVAEECKGCGKYLLIVAPPSAVIPDELIPLAAVIDHALPAAAEFKELLPKVTWNDQVVVLTEEEQTQIAEASGGLTRLQAEAAYAVSTVRRKGKIDPLVIEELKDEILNVDKIITRYKGPETFESIGGYTELKRFLRSVMQPAARRKTSRLRAVALVGPPGTGKTMLAKALGNEMKIKSYAVDLNKCKDKWVGSTESSGRKLFARMDAMAPIIAYFDEVNQMIAEGGQGEHSTDKALLQMTLVWLNDHTSDVFCVLTANDVSNTHMALLRPGRVDAIWYVGLPSEEQKKEVWRICLAKYGLQQGQPLLDDTGWAGAEIDACCRMAHNLEISLIEASKYIIPTSIRVGDQIDNLKKWCDGRVLDAETGEVYQLHNDRAKEQTAKAVKRAARSI